MMGVIQNFPTAKASLGFSSSSLRARGETSATAIREAAATRHIPPLAEAMDDDEPKSAAEASWTFGQRDIRNAPPTCGRRHFARKAGGSFSGCALPGSAGSIAAGAAYH